MDDSTTSTDPGPAGSAARYDIFAPGAVEGSSIAQAYADPQQFGPVVRCARRKGAERDGELAHLLTVRGRPAATFVRAETGLRTGFIAVVLVGRWQLSRRLLDSVFFTADAPHRVDLVARFLRRTRPWRWVAAVVHNQIGEPELLINVRALELGALDHLLATEFTTIGQLRQAERRKLAPVFARGEVYGTESAALILALDQLTEAEHDQAASVTAKYLRSLRPRTAGERVQGALTRACRQARIRPERSPQSPAA